MSNTYNPPRNSDGRFGPGNPGRRPGARNKVTRRIVLAVLADFEANQEAVLLRLRKYNLDRYIALVGKLLPREVELCAPDPDELSDEEVAIVMARARLALDRMEEGRGCLADLEAAVLETPVPAAPVLKASPGPPSP